MSSPSDEDLDQAAVWRRRRELAAARLVSATHRDAAARDREDAARVRDEAARIRVEGSRVRDDAARARDAAARVRDDAARVRDDAARIRETALATREEATRRRLVSTTIDLEAWAEVMRVDALAAAQSREAGARDREAAGLDRVASNRDRDAAEMDREAATKDRDAADRDRDAAEKDREGADKDRLAAEGEREAAEVERALGEQRLDLSEKLASLGQLAAGLAHELSTPLTSLTYNIALVQREIADHASIGGADDALWITLRGLVGEAETATARMGRVLADTKTWLRRDGHEGGPTRVDMIEVVARVVRQSRPLLPAGDDITTSLKAPAYVHGFSARLGQLVTNLLVNAIQSSVTPARPNRIHVSLETTRESIVIEIRDSGAGIAPDALPKIFDPFVATRGPGTSSLGLAVCREIASAHGGVLTVASVLGEGATFHVELPAFVEPPVAATGLRAIEEVEKRPRVLVIDDDVALRRVMTRMLQRACDIDTAEDGAEGWERMRSATVPYDVILCDLMMPRMNGRELVALVERERPDLAPSMVILTGGSTDPVNESFLATTGRRVLEKPVSMAELLVLIGERTRQRE